MSLNERQYERVADWLDGQDVELSDAERAAAEEIRRLERQLGAAIRDVPVPARAMARARRRLLAATAARPVARRRFLVLAAAGTAAAAAILALSLWLAGPETSPPPRPVLVRDANEVLRVWMASMDRPAAGEVIEMLAEELDRMEAELAICEPASVLDRRIETLEQDINDLFSDVPPWWAPEG